MAGGKPKAEVLIDLNISDALGGLNEFSDRIKTTMDVAKDSVRSLSIAWNAASKVVTVIVDNMVQWASAAAEVDKVERSLAAAAKLRGDATGAATRGLIAYNSALEQKLGIDAEDLATQQKKLLAMGVSVDRLQEATKATIGLSQVTENLDSAAVLVGKAYDGNTTALKRWGIEARSAEEAIRKTVELYSIAEANVGTYGTQVQILERNMENLESDLGKVLIENKDLVETINIFSRVVVTVTPVLSKMLDWYVSIETAIPRAINWWKENVTILGFLKKEVKDTTDEMNNMALAQQILAAGAPIAEGPAATLSNHPLVTGNRGGRITIPNPVGSRTNPVKPKQLKPVAPTGRISSSAQPETFSAIDLGIPEIEIMESRAEEFFRIQDEVLDAKYEHLRKMADLDLQALIADRESADLQNEVLLERKQNVEFALSAVEQFAQSAVGATKAMIDQLIENLTSGTAVSGRALTLVLAEAMIQQGWAFQQQAIALTFEAVANYGATAWRAAAMGSAAKTMLIAGYALKAGVGRRSGGGGGGARASAPSGGGGAGGGGGFGGGFSGLPSAPFSNRNDQGGSKTVIVNINKPVGSPARLKREYHEIMRDDS